MVREKPGSPEQFQEMEKELQSLRRKNKELEFIFSMNPNPILIWDPDLRVIDVNDAFLEATGWSRSKVLSLSLQDFVTLEKKGEGISETVRDKTKKTGEGIFKFPSGIVTWIRHTIPVLDEQGKIEYILSVYNDITEQRRQMDEIQILQQRAHDIVYENPYPIIVWSPDLRVEDMNPAALVLMGYKKEDIGRLTIKDFHYISQSGKGVTDTFKSREPNKGEATMDFPSGKKVVERYNIPLIDKKGTVYSVLTVYYDVTHQKHAIADILMVANEAEEGNLTVRTQEKEYTGDFFEIAHGLNQVLDTVVSPFRIFKTQLEELTANAEEVTASAKEVANGTNAIAENANAVGSNAEQGDDGVKQVLRAMEDLNTTVSDIAVRSESVAKLSIAADEKTRMGVELAKKAEEVMGGITRNSGEVDVIVRDIKNQMDQIGKIVNLITDIANQTNLLALNAAIEAARAGEAGRGFAVVAAEVKSLAQDSRKSAEDIADMIRTLQNKSVQAATAVNNAGLIVNEGNAALSETLTAFNTIAVSVEDISKNVAEVAAVSEEQAASVEEITASINELSSLLQTTAKQAVDSAAATEQASAAVTQIEHAISEVSGNVEKITLEMSKFKI
ncbi:MAG: PAS domain-containing methyl-accepting chemotaxis protein [Methanospirillum sp.]|nr:PAS domain-containing methyl-accepting chemotaxis protein [Methanospirillum sp.]